MKLLSKGAVGAATVILAIAPVRSFAIEGLKLAVQCPNVIPSLLDVEINASNGFIEMVVISSRETQRPAPKVAVEPPAVQNSQQTGTSATPDGQKLSKASERYAQALLEAILPQISEFTSKAGLPTRNPLSTNDVDLAQYVCLNERGRPNVQLYLKNGDRFNYQNGHIVAFYAHDAFYKFTETGKAENFIGKQNISTNEAIAMAKRAIKNLGYKNDRMDVGTGGPFYVGRKEFIRFFAHFHRPEDNAYIAAFEIDLEQKAIKSIYLDDPSLWRESPKIDFPIME